MQIYYTVSLLSERDSVLALNAGITYYILKERTVYLEFIVAARCRRRLKRDTPFVFVRTALFFLSLSLFLFLFLFLSLLHVFDTTIRSMIHSFVATTKYESISALIGP